MVDIGRSYREAAVTGASPVELVVRLYEQMIEDLRQAVKAFDQNDVESRTNKINHAILVLAHLQSHLEFSSGGQVARDLDKFYNVVRDGLVHAQISCSKQLLSHHITDLLTVREAWIEVQRAETQLPPNSSRRPRAVSGAADDPPSEPEHLRLEWKA